MRTFVQQLPLGVFLFGVAMCLVMSGVMATAGIHARRRATLIAETATTPIGIAQDGYREFEGVAEALGPPLVIAPLTGTSCVWYSARVERWERSVGATRSDWRTVRSVTSSAPFLVRDATGRCAVYPQAADVTPTDSSTWKGGTPEPQDRNPPRLRRGATPANVLEVSGGANSTYRYSEARIYPGDALLVLGHFSSGRFDATEDDDADDEDLDTEMPLPDEPDADQWQAADDAVAERLAVVAAAVTRSAIATGGSDEPLVLSTVAQHEAVVEGHQGGMAAYIGAAVPLGLALLLAWLRLGSA